MKKIIGSTGLLLIVILFINSCSSQKLSKVDAKEIRAVSELKEQINKYITADEKRASLLKIADEIEQETRSFFTFYQEHNQRLSQVNTNYKATRQDFDKLIDEFNGKYENYLRMLLLKRGNMRELTNDDEWKKIMEREYSFIPG
jgi:hypothetical protein